MRTSSESSQGFLAKKSTRPLGADLAPSEDFHEAPDYLIPTLDQAGLENIIAPPPPPSDVVACSQSSKSIGMLEDGSQVRHVIDLIAAFPAVSRHGSPFLASQHKVKNFLGY